MAEQRTALRLSMYGERQFITRAPAEGASAYAEQLADHLARDRAGMPHEALSSRELEVYLLLAAVSTYRSRILEKMFLESNAEIIQYAIRNGLVG